MKRMHFKRLSGLALAIALGLVLGSDAQAGPLVLRISSGGNVLSVTDNSGNDADPALNRVTIAGATLAGMFSTLTTNSTLTASSNQAMAGTDSFSELARSTALFQNPGTATTTYVIEASQTDFDYPGGNPKFAEEVHTGSFLNAAGSMVNFDGFIDQPNTLFGTATLITPDTPTFTATTNGLQPYAFVGGPTTFSDDLYALTSRTTTSLTANGELQSQSRIVVTAVPEPSSIAMAGLGLIGLIGVARRRRIRTATAG